MRTDSITYVIGSSDIVVKPLEPFSNIVCDFLNELSIKFRNDSEAVLFPDIMSLAFWCRKANIQKLREDYIDNKKRIGRGLAFHIAPSNIPVNFAFSYFFGLLSGNSNIVRLPSKNYPQVAIICRIINEVLKDNYYEIIKNTTAMITYERNDSITSYYSSICDCRIIWGGNETIRNIRSLPIKERTIEVAFSDRYSMGILDSEAILQLSKEKLNRLSEQFYNDTFLMDQNACSTPYLLLWHGENSELKEKAKKVFWEAVFENSKKYDLSQIKAVDKYTQLCENAMDFNNIENIATYENYLYVLNLNNLNAENEMLRGRFGLFYEYDIEDLDNIKPFIKKNIQTLTYFGMDKGELLSFIMDNNLEGIDRIVPIGSALDMGIIWDGYDIIGTLSRIIDIK